MDEITHKAKWIGDCHRELMRLCMQQGRTYGADSTMQIAKLLYLENDPYKQGPLASAMVEFVAHRNPKEPKVKRPVGGTFFARLPKPERPPEGK